MCPLGVMKRSCTASLEVAGTDGEHQSWIARVLEKVENVRRLRDGFWAGRCPICRRGERTLSIELDPDENHLRFRCSHGCIPKEIVRAIGAPISRPGGLGTRNKAVINFPIGDARDGRGPGGTAERDRLADGYSQENRHVDFIGSCGVPMQVNTKSNVVRANLPKDVRKRLTAKLPNVELLGRRRVVAGRKNEIPRFYRREGKRRLTQHDACDFVQVARFVVLDEYLSPLATKVYLIVAAHAGATTVGKTGTAFVSQATIAAYCGRSETSGTISKAIRELEEADYIYRKRRWGRSNLYYLRAEENRVGCNMERERLLIGLASGTTGRGGRR